MAVNFVLVLRHASCGLASKHGGLFPIPCQFGFQGTGICLQLVNRRSLSPDYRLRVFGIVLSVALHDPILAMHVCKLALTHSGLRFRDLTHDVKINQDRAISHGKVPWELLRTRK